MIIEQDAIPCKSTEENHGLAGLAILRGMSQRIFRLDRVPGSWGTVCPSLPDKPSTPSGREVFRLLCFSLCVLLVVKDASVVTSQDNCP